MATTVPIVGKRETFCVFEADRPADFAKASNKQEEPSHGNAAKMFGLPLGSMIPGSRLHCALPSNQAQFEPISVPRRTPSCSADFVGSPGMCVGKHTLA
jgi:hypothetical protein